MPAPMPGAAGRVLGSPVLQGDPLPVPETGPDEARREAERILSGFEWDQPDGDENFLQSLVSAIGDAIGSVLGALFGSGIVTVLVWVALAALVGVVVWLVVRNRRARPRSQRKTPTVRSIEASKTPDEWLALASDLESRGEWKLALRARYRSLVSHLIGARHLRDVPGRTTGEYRIELRDALPSVAAPFEQATDLFDRAWYGDRPTGPDEARTFQSLADEVLGSVPA